MDFINGLSDAVAEFFIQFLGLIPSGDNISTEQYFVNLSTVKGYLNYFIPFNEMLSLWVMFMVAFVGATIAIIIIKTVRKGIFDF